MKTVNIYTDGACSGNQNENNTGGWGCILEFGNAKRELCSGEVRTTNNRMELQALIAGLSALKEEGLNVNVYSDSSYLINCFKEKWFESWEKNGWKTASKKPVENRPLWEQLLSLVRKHNVRFMLVKGHVNKNSKASLKAAKDLYEKHNGSIEDEAFIKLVDMNNRADELANVFVSEEKGEMPKAYKDDVARKSIMFDLDGTLWDSVPQIVESWNTAFERAGVRSDVSLDEMRPLMGKLLPEIAAALFPEFPEDRQNECLALASDCEIEYLRDNPGVLYEGLAETLDVLSRDYDLFLISNCQVGYIESFFYSTGMGRFFKDFDCAGRAHLPKDENIKRMMQKYGITQCIYVGDTVRDKDAAQSAGIPFVHAAYGFGDLPGEKYAVARPSELIELVKGLL